MNRLAQYMQKIAQVKHDGSEDDYELIAWLDYAYEHLTDRERKHVDVLIEHLKVTRGYTLS